MRPLLIVVALLLLVAASLLTGVVASDWPFWQRAWRWHAAAPLPPDSLPGAHAWVSAHDGARDLPLDADPAVTGAVSRLLEGDITAALLVARDDRLLFEYYGPSSSAGARFDARELAVLPLVALYGAALERGVDVALDRPISEALTEWRGEGRGAITPRQLLQGLSGLEVPTGVYLDPFDAGARLHSGPNFERAALSFGSAWPAGSHFAANPADAQLAAAVLVRTTGQPLTALLDAWVAEPLGFDSVQVLLDRHRGAMAAHCCLRARARDWLGLGLLLAQQGTVAGQRIYSQRFAAEIGTSSPVAPERALGLERVTLGGDTGFLIAGRQRLLLADPVSRTAWLWIAGADFEPGHRAALLEAASADR